MKYSNYIKGCYYYAYYDGRPYPAIVLCIKDSNSYLVGHGLNCAYNGTRELFKHNTWCADNIIPIDSSAQGWSDINALHRALGIEETNLTLQDYEIY